MAGRPKRRALREAGELVAVERDRHGPGCTCKRCVGLRGAVDGVPFEPGNSAAVTHGAYSTLLIGPRATEIADGLREIVPVSSPSDEPTIRLLAQTLARVERASAALDAADSTFGARPLGAYLIEDAVKLQRLREDLRGWINTASRLANDLGLTPTSRARLGLDIAATRRTLSLIEVYAEEGGP